MISKLWNESPSNWWHFYAGVVIFAGTTLIYPLSDIALIPLIIWAGLRIRWEICTLAGIVAVTSLWSSDAISPLWFGLRIIFLYSIIARANLSNRHFWLGMGVVGIIQLGASIYQLASGTAIFDGRPHGLSMNSSQLGLGSLALSTTPLAILGAFNLGLSTARTMAIGLAVWTIFVRRDYVGFIIAALAAVTFLYTIEFTGDRRLEIKRIQSDYELRENIVTAPPAVVDSVRESKPYSDWLGFGYRSYVLDTGLQRPHNVWQLSRYELGALSLIFWAVIVWAAVRHRLWWLLPLAAVGWFTDELFARPEGAYSLITFAAGYYLLVAARRRKRIMEASPGNTMTVKGTSEGIG